MKIYNYSFFTLFIFFISSLTFCSQQEHYHEGKLAPYKYNPWEKLYDYQYNTMKTHACEKIHERVGTCYLYAIAKSLEITEPIGKLLPLSAGEELITECNIMQYYEQIENPTTGSIAVYTDKNNRITHFAIVTDTDIHVRTQKCMVTAKCGLIPFIYETDIFQHKSYGTTVAFYEKNPNLTNQQIIDALQSSISQSNTIKERLLYQKNHLLSLADRNNTSCRTNMCLHKQSPYKDAWYILKGSIGLPVDCRCLNNTTPLMLATAKNNLAMMQLLLEMGACPYTQNNHRSSALIISHRYKHHNAMQLLLRYIKDPNIPKLPIAYHPSPRPLYFLPCVIRPHTTTQQHTKASNQS